MDEEQRVLSTTNKPAHEPDPTWMTGRLWEYNLLNFEYPEIKELKEIIYQEYVVYMNSMGLTPEPVYIQCWMNILRNNGRIISPHDHSNAHGEAPAEYSYMSGNIAIQTENTTTNFANPFLGLNQYIEVPNKNGEMILFPSFVTHWTSQNKSETPRITISFDIITEEVYNMIDNHNFLKLC
jgi:hypothetical protein